MILKILKNNKNKNSMNKISICLYIETPF